MKCDINFIGERECEKEENQTMWAKAGYIIFNAHLLISQWISRILISSSLVHYSAVFHFTLIDISSIEAVRIEELSKFGGK